MYIPSATPSGPRAKRGQGISFPAQRFRQGPRIAYNVVFPFAALSQFIEIDKIGAVTNEINREIKKQHVQACEHYLEEEEEFVFGGLVLAADAMHLAFQADDPDVDQVLAEFDKNYTEACETKDEPRRATLAHQLNELNDKVPVCHGKLWMPYGVRLEVTDGQHRIKTILSRIKDDDERFTHSSQGIAAMILIESRRQKRQQDFVDLGQTEAIKPTIKISMDWRQPVTKLVKDMVETVPVFDEQFIEFKRPSIRKASRNLYSLANLKIAVQAMLLGNTRLGAADAQRRLTAKLGGTSYDPVSAVVIDFFSRLSQEVEPFKAIVEDPDSVDYAHEREHWMCLNSVGLAVMGMVGHDVMLNRIPLEEAVAGIARIDWSRDNKLWEGTLRLGPGVARGGNVIELGGSLVKAAAGLPLTPRDAERINAVQGLAARLPSGWQSNVVASDGPHAADDDESADEDAAAIDDPDLAATTA